MSRWAASVAAAVLLAVAACSPSAPSVPEGADPALREGRDLYQSSCVQCHGADGGGGRGPKLSGGAVVEAYPDLGTQIVVVREGKGGMPAFGDKLSTAEIEAVVRYTREVL